MDEKVFDYAVRLAAGALAGGALENVGDAAEFVFHSYQELTKARQTIIDEAEEQD